MLSNILDLARAQATQFGQLPAGAQQLQTIILTLIGYSVALAFMALTIMFIYAGLKFILSGGEPKNIQSARNTATYAVIGIIMLVIAWLILQLIQAITGVCVTRFSIGFSLTC